MERALIALTFAACALGCSHTQMQLNAGAVSTSSGGGTISSSGAAVNVHSSGSTAAVLIGLGVAAAIVHGAEERGGYGTRYNMNPFLAVTGTTRAPELAPNRAVNEQDCTQPVADTTANLKCR